jgi:lipoprotein-anchoring transpeptidase ErfK/SrfK
MATDYFSILSKAVARTDGEAARRDIYHRARNAVASLRPGENLTLQQIAAEARALEAAIARVEAGFAPSPEPEPVPEPVMAAQRDEEIAEVLTEPTDWKRIGAVAALFLVVAGVAGLALWYFGGGQRTRVATELPVPRQIADGREVLAAELDPGIDGGSSSADLPFAYQRQAVFYRSTIVPGSIVVDREQRYLYLIQSDTSARRYGIGISSECRKPGSLYRVTDMKEWPAWAPTAGDPQTVQIKSLPGGPGNPLGARLLLLDQPQRLIHGTNSPKTIGRLVALGCIRMVNDDVEDLYRRVTVDTKVIMRN